VKIAIFGGAGYIGSALTRHLRSLGHTVLVFDSLIHHQGHDPGVITDDICRVKPEWLEGVDVVYNLAALVSEWVCREQSDEARRVNVVGATALAQACILAGVSRYVFASTASVYDGRRGSHDDLLKEEHAYPLGTYGRTKLEAENHLVAVACGRPSSASRARPGRGTTSLSR
jgi:UDP-glucose 4-epimerase